MSQRHFLWCHDGVGTADQANEDSITLADTPAPIRSGAFAISAAPNVNTGIGTGRRVLVSVDSPDDHLHFVLQGLGQGLLPGGGFDPERGSYDARVYLGSTLLVGTTGLTIRSGYVVHLEFDAALGRIKYQALTTTFDFNDNPIDVPTEVTATGTSWDVTDGPMRLGAKVSGMVETGNNVQGLVSLPYWIAES